MIKLNKKAAANAGTFTTAQKNRADSHRLSDKIKVLYRYIFMPKKFKNAIHQAINCYYYYNIDNSNINN